MKCQKTLITIIFLFIANVLLSQVIPQIVNPKDSLRLKQSPYFFPVEKRPLTVSPTLWKDYPVSITNQEMASEAIKIAKDNYDYYRVFQIATLELFENDTVRSDVYGFVQNYGFTFQDPWILYYMVNHLQLHPVSGGMNLKADMIANVCYTSAVKRKEAAILRKLAVLQKETSYILGVSVEDIQKKAKEFEGGIVMNYGQCVNSKSMKHEGTIISGDSLKGKKVYTQSDEVVKNAWNYEGDFLNGYESFQGKLFNENEQLIYQGQWDKGLFAGNGKLYSKNKLLYHGLFLNGVYHGNGEIYDETGKKYYSGQFSEGRISGKGKYFYPNGEIYEGDFLNGIKQGKGIYLYADSTKYEGDFSNDARHGKGKLFNSKKQVIYVGDFANNQQTGTGISYNLVDSSRYEGSFINGAMTGKVLHIFKDDKRRYEVWDKGKHVSDGKEEPKLATDSINKLNKKEKSPAKIVGKTYTIEFLGSTEKEILDSQTVIYTFSDSIFKYSFTETTNIKFKRLKTEEILALLDKSISVITDSLQVDILKMSNKGGMWYRQVHYFKNGKSYAQVLYIDAIEGKSYEIQVVNNKGKSVRNELDQFVNRFIYTGIKK